MTYSRIGPSPGGFAIFLTSHLQSLLLNFPYLQDANIPNRCKVREQLNGAHPEIYDHSSQHIRGSSVFVEDKIFAIILPSVIQAPATHHYFLIMARLIILGKKTQILVSEYGVAVGNIKSFDWGQGVGSSSMEHFLKGHVFPDGHERLDSSTTHPRSSIAVR